MLNCTAKTMRRSNSSESFPMIRSSISFESLPPGSVKHQVTNQAMSRFFIVGTSAHSSSASSVGALRSKAMSGDCNAPNVGKMRAGSDIKMRKVGCSALKSMVFLVWFAATAVFAGLGIFLR